MICFVRNLGEKAVTIMASQPFLSKLVEYNTSLSLSQIHLKNMRVVPEVCSAQDNDERWINILIKEGSIELIIDALITNTTSRPSGCYFYKESESANIESQR
jgi:hypothetical protein